MSTDLNSLPESQRWRLLVDAAKKGAQGSGFGLTRIPGRGLSNMWTIQRGKDTHVAAIRTTRDRWIAFPPMNGGKNWKTLDDVDTVLVAAVDDPENAQNVEVYIFPANEVRERFSAAYQAREAAGHVQKDNFGLWVGLDADDRNIASSVGSGLTSKYKPVAVYSVAELAASPALVPEEAVVPIEEGTDPDDLPAPTTIADVMKWSRERIAQIAGVGIEAVKLELKLEV